MLKFNLLLLNLLLIGSLYSSQVHAQTKIWGVGTAVGVADAEFQNAFIQDTMGPFAPTSWTALSVFEAFGNVTPGNAFWERSLLGYSRDYYSNPPFTPVATPLASPSQPNGVALFDSGYMDNDSTASVGVGSSPAGHRGELISPRIDLTGYTDSALVVKFFSRFSPNTPANTNEVSVGISTDDGATWTSFDYREIQQPEIGAFIAVPFPTATAGITGLTQCRIRFVFDSYYYYAMVDDITIEVAPDYDIAMGRPSLLDNSLSGRADIVRIGGNRYQSLSNIDAGHLEEWFWGAKLLNYGGKTIYPSDNPKMYVSIDFTDAANNVTTDVYLDTMNLDTLEAGQYDGYEFIKSLRDVNFILMNGAGTYNVKYWVGHDNMDAFTYNDTTLHTFDITSDAAPFIAKGELRSDGRIGVSRPFFPGANDVTSLEWGSVYHFPKGQTNNVNIDSLEFRYYIHRTYSGVDSHTVYANIYKVVDGSGSTPANGRIDADELTLVGFNQTIISGLSSAPAPSYGVGVVSNFIDPAIGNPFAGFEDDGWYYISVKQDPANTGGPSSISFQTGLWFGGHERNYSLNVTNRAPNKIINPSPLFITTVSGTGSGQSWNGWVEGPHVPCLGLHLTPDSTNTNVLTAVDGTPFSLEVSPNPATEEINISVDFESITDVQYTLTDATGRIVEVLQVEQVTTEQRTINIEHLPVGIYFLTAKTEQGSTTQRVVKQ
ncbi:MAG: T9SS type A sorting domain-containing protein [Aureispira sp.]